MNWLRSEDLNEEKVITTSKLSISRPEGICSFQIEAAGFDASCLQLKADIS
jgi:hypothetical protein